MTADERIERLLNRFGQTISDLPITYHPSHRYSARSAAYKWFEKNKPELLEVPFVAIAMLPTYICHLCDIIDRMEIALETAARCADCGTCEVEHTEECGGGAECNYRILDRFLLDLNEEDVERYIDDAD